MKYLILLVCVFTGINAFSQTVPGIGHKPDSTADERAYVVVEQMPEHPGD